MARSVKSHRRPNDLFIIALKHKLYLDIFPPTNLPTCLCGATIDSRGRHVFNCKRISKWACHNRIRNGGAPILAKLLKTAGILSPTTGYNIEPPNILPNLPNCRPFDFSFRPDNHLTSNDHTPCPYSELGFDVTITPSKGYLPPSRSRASLSNRPLPPQKHLTEKEKHKLSRSGMIDATGQFVPGNIIIKQLLDQQMVLIPFAVSPLGRWGPMFHNFLFGRTSSHHPLSFRSNTSSAAKMYHRATTSPCPIGLIPLATAQWKHSKPDSQHFYGHSHTAPTPKEYALQQLGLVISNALAIHLRDAKRGTLQPAPPELLRDDPLPDNTVDSPEYPDPSNQVPAHDTLLESLFPDPVSLAPIFEPNNTDPSDYCINNLCSL